MPVIPSTALSPSVFSPPATPLATIAPLAFAASPATAASLAPVGGQSAHDRSPALDGRLAQSLRADLRSAVNANAEARTRRSVYDHRLVKRAITNLIYEMQAANERGDRPFSNRELLGRLIELAPGDGIRPEAIPQLMDLRLPSLLLTERGFEPGTMDALYYNIGKLRSSSLWLAPTLQYVAEGRALLNSLIRLNHEENLANELDLRTNVAVMVHAKANNVPGLEDWAATDGYPPHLIATRAVAVDHINHERGKLTVVEAQIEARRIDAGYDAVDAFDSAFMWLFNLVQQVPPIVTAPFEALRR
ncbi:hypothetical protein PIN31115_00421 [Pandoraea iniqua]|uniref:Uncharacterized protein n=1 Tax=Pandoraea iniqua TaxID=2508288 RepID=A0A5E4RW86_9BURK|nr:hypothetical protein [Pandoraea iniqua]VVD67507.1 hypothetical protein PIN31115_00421 [Pandoraea iniqua]